ncbi:hypothetical protein LZ554_008735 [Drepanopeziza brunnea f. sp. 'monogermtubi']|nr:hypothetical protein LZ554_008735 [Drepanopeziza brunnea f. sp. 'monogermtubi']
MRFSPLSLFALAATTVLAVDMTSYEPNSDVDPKFANFVEQYYLTSEDKNSVDAFLSFWPPTGRLIVAGTLFEGYGDILAVKLSLLPPTGDKAWWHIIRGASVGAETDTDKTLIADIVIQTTYHPGNCSQAYGSAAFTILKDANGELRLDPYSQSLSLYNLTVSTTESSIDIPCYV